MGQYAGKLVVVAEAQRANGGTNFVPAEVQHSCDGAIDDQRAAVEPAP